MAYIIFIVWRIGQGRHRLSVRFIRFPPNKKCPCSPKGNKDRKNISAVPPCLPVFRPLCPVPTHRLPRNAGNASKDTRGASPFPLPSAAHLLLRFSLRSQLCETLCGCACSFTSASKVCCYWFVLLNYIFVRLSSTIFHIPWKMVAKKWFLWYDGGKIKVRKGRTIWIME